jgi:hypothetical protein
MECKAKIACAGCGTVEDASTEAEGEAVRQLDCHLERDGWRLANGKPYCLDCIRHLVEQHMKRLGHTQTGSTAHEE